MTMKETPMSVARAFLMVAVMATALIVSLALLKGMSELDQALFSNKPPAKTEP